MKKTAICLFAMCAVVALLVPTAHAQCPEGKQPVTMVTPSGKSKILCIPDNAVGGIENAADHSSTTVVPSLCPADCWTAADLEKIASSGTLECTQSSVDGSMGCILYNPDGTYQRSVSLLGDCSGDGTATCLGTGGIIKGFELKADEADACRALLEPYNVTSLLPCPCWTDVEFADLSKGKGFYCVEGSNIEGKYIQCYDDYYGKNLFLMLNSLPYCVNEPGNVKLKLFGDEVMACATDLEPYVKAPVEGPIVELP